MIGVARDTRGVTLDGSDSEQVYLPLARQTGFTITPFFVRTHSDPTLVMRAMGPVISAVDPSLVASTSTLQQMLRQTDSFLIDSFSAAIASSISLFGLLLASMGIYSTVSYIVVLRTREVGIRMAIGAQKRDILALMMRESSRPVFAGLLAGMVLAAGASHLLRGVLYGLNTVDAISFAAASLLFLSIALVATLAAVPASDASGSCRGAQISVACSRWNCIARHSRKSLSHPKVKPAPLAIHSVMDSVWGFLRSRTLNPG